MRCSYSWFFLPIEDIAGTSDAFPNKYTCCKRNPDGHFGALHLRYDAVRLKLKSELIFLGERMDHLTQRQCWERTAKKQKLLCYSPTKKCQLVSISVSSIGRKQRKASSTTKKCLILSLFWSNRINEEPQNERNWNMSGKMLKKALLRYCASLRYKFTQQMTEGVQAKTSSVQKKILGFSKQESNLLWRKSSLVARSPSPWLMAR